MTRNTGYIVYQLKELQRQGALASVFTDPHNPDDFIAGYVRGVNARTALLQSTSPFGRFDGFFGVRLSCVLEVSLDAQYAERLLVLLKINGEQADPLPDAELDWQEGDHIGLMLRHAQRRERVVTVWTSDEAYTGFVGAVDDLRVSLELLDFMGKKVGPMPVNLTDIELCSIGSEEERMYEKLGAHTD